MTIPLKHPDLFEWWKGHDLSRWRPPFYHNLLPEHEILVWQYIEQHYLNGHYRSLIRVEFEWSAEGIWQIPFPGSVDMGEMLSPEDFYMPKSLIAQIRDWHKEIDDNARPWDANDRFDYDASHEKGFRVALEVKRFLGAGYYVEYNYFKELVIVDGDVKELDIPTYIKQFCKKDTVQ